MLREKANSMVTLMKKLSEKRQKSLIQGGFAQPCHEIISLNVFFDGNEAFGLDVDHLFDLICEQLSCRLVSVGCRKFSAPTVASHSSVENLIMC